MDQVVQFNPDFVISSLNVHRLLITSIMLASKFFDDGYYNNAYYARVGGISNSEVRAPAASSQYRLSASSPRAFSPSHQAHSPLRGACSCVASPRSTR